MHQPLSLLSFKALFSFKLKGDFLSLEILYTGDLKNGLNYTWGFLVGKGSLREGGKLYAGRDRGKGKRQVYKRMYSWRLAFVIFFTLRGIDPDGIFYTQTVKYPSHGLHKQSKKDNI